MEEAGLCWVALGWGGVGWNVGAKMLDWEILRVVSQKFWCDGPGE